MVHTVTYSKSYNKNQNFGLFINTLTSIVTLGAASTILFFLGFYVIPVFADKAPHMFSVQASPTELLDGKSMSQLPQ